MNGPTPAQIHNWLSLYAATGICAAIASVLAAASIAFDVVRFRELAKVQGALEVFLLVPHLWWRWQKRYLTATPVILAIVAFYAAGLHW